MTKLTLSIGAYASSDYSQAIMDVILQLPDEPLAEWMLAQNIPIDIRVTPRISKRFPNTNSNPIFTAEVNWVLSDDVQTALHLKFYPLPTPRASIGVWTIS